MLVSLGLVSGTTVTVFRLVEPVETGCAFTVVVVVVFVGAGFVLLRAVD